MAKLGDLLAWTPLGQPPAGHGYIVWVVMSDVTPYEGDAIARKIVEGDFSGNLPLSSGTYALLLVLHQSVQLRIGALGEYYFSAGWYVYVGSALLGPGGLAARVGRHIGVEGSILLAHRLPHAVCRNHASNLARGRGTLGVQLGSVHWELSGSAIGGLRGSEHQTVAVTLICGLSLSALIWSDFL